MDINYYPHPLFFILTLLTLLTTSTSSFTSPQPSPPPPLPMQEVNNIINALIGSGDTNINKWVSILSLSNPLLSLTLFIPQQQQPQQQLNPFSFPYHVIPQRLTFSDLLLLPPNARLPTLLPGKTIVVTDNSDANFSVDTIPITHPDLYSTPSLAVHGVRSLLDYSLFGDANANAMPSMKSPPFLPAGGGATWKSGTGATVDTTVNVFCFSCFVFQLLFV